MKQGGAASGVGVALKQQTWRNQRRRGNQPRQISHISVAWLKYRQREK